MSLNIKHAGSWRNATEVHIKQDGAWKKCTEVYINKDGSWKPVLYDAETSIITTTGSGTIVVPKGAFRASITISGASGGKGGHDGGRNGGDGGLGAKLTATVDVDPFTTLSYDIGSTGGNGGSGSGNSGGAGGTGYAPGGAGGRTGSAGWSGSGGGGGAASSILMPDSTIIMVAAGGSGGGGRGNQAHLSQSAITGKNGTTIVDTEFTPNSGGNGANCGTADGGAGGGGGGGVAGHGNVTESYNADSWGYAYATTQTNLSAITDVHLSSRRSGSACTEGYSFGYTGTSIWVNHGCRATFIVNGTADTGAGGAYMGSYDSDGYPGEAGVSYYNSDKLQTYPTLSTNTGNGVITITWLP
jgi:hypothetical protein